MFSLDINASFSFKIQTLNADKETFLQTPCSHLTEHFEANINVWRDGFSVK